MKRNIYETDRSCYAINEGVWVPGKGVNQETAPAIAALILRDYLRGYTYSHQCAEIPMDHDLFIKRLVYLIALARKHYGPEVAAWVKDLVDYVIIHGSLPPSITVRLEGNPEAIARIARELAGKAVVEGVPPPVPVAVPAVVRRRRRRYAYAYA